MLNYLPLHLLHNYTIIFEHKPPASKTHVHLMQKLQYIKALINVNLSVKATRSGLPDCPQIYVSESLAGRRSRRAALRPVSCVKQVDLCAYFGFLYTDALAVTMQTDKFLRIAAPSLLIATCFHSFLHFY